MHNQQPITLPPPPVPIGFSKPQWVTGWNPPKVQNVPVKDERRYRFWLERLSTK